MTALAGRAAGAQDATAEVFRLVNEVRAANGVAPLTRAWELDAAAKLHSVYMATRGVLSHVGAGGTLPGDRMSAMGYDWVLWGENIAEGYDSAAEVMAGWMSSPGHRANILNPRFKEIGIGVVDLPFSRSRYYWTQDFGTRDEERPTTDDRGTTVPGPVPTPAPPASGDGASGDPQGSGTAPLPTFPTGFPGTAPGTGNGSTPVLTPANPTGPTAPVSAPGTPASGTSAPATVHAAPATVVAPGTPGTLSDLPTPVAIPAPPTTGTPTPPATAPPTPTVTTPSATAPTGTTPAVPSPAAPTPAVPSPAPATPSGTSPVVLPAPSATAPSALPAPSAPAPVAAPTPSPAPTPATLPAPSVPAPPMPAPSAPPMPTPPAPAAPTAVETPAPVGDPVLDEFSPASGPAGTELTLTGENLVLPGGTMRLMLRSSRNGSVYGTATILAGSLTPTSVRVRLYPASGIGFTKGSYYVWVRRYQGETPTGAYRYSNTRVFTFR